MAKQIIYGEDARKALLSGIDKKYGAPLITNDGVTIAKEIELDDPFENMGAQLVKEVSTKTNDAAGDGTTTATLLAQALIREGMKNIAAGANPMVVKKGIAEAVDTTVEEVKKNSQKVKDSADIARVATVSSGETLCKRFPQTALSLLRKERPQKQAARSLKVCSLTEATSALIWLPIWKRW